MVVNDFICKTALLSLFKGRCRNCGTLLYIFPPTFQLTFLQIRFPEKPQQGSAARSLFQLLLYLRVPGFIFIWGLSHIPAVLSNLLESCLLSAVAEGRNPFCGLRWGAGAHPGQTQPHSARTGQGGLWKPQKRWGKPKSHCSCSLVPCGSCPEVRPSAAK